MWDLKNREYIVLENSSFLGGGSRAYQWPDQSLESSFPRCKLLYLSSPFDSDFFDLFYYFPETERVSTV